MDVATVLNSLNAKVRTLNARSHMGRAMLNVTVEVKNLTALNQIIARLRSVRGVQEIQRGNR